MTDQSLRRADNLLTELVDMVETARNLPMSSSCVVPREQLLDLLDDLREVMPAEIDAARKIIGARDALLHEAYTTANDARESARSEAASVEQGAQSRATQLVHDAEVQAAELAERAQAEHASLVSATRVHQEASSAAARLIEDATAYDQRTRADADSYAAHTRSEAERFSVEHRAAAERYSVEQRADAETYALKLMSDGDDYADRTLAELAQTLQHAAATAEQGRAAIAQRRSRYPEAQFLPAPSPERQGRSGPGADRSVGPGDAGVAEHRDDVAPWDQARISA